MASTGELIGLLHQIRGARSSMEKLKLAAFAWRTLRGLPPADRLQVARELGLEGAERIVEGLSQRGGLSPSMLLSAIHRAEQADPGQLEALLESLRDPAQRAEVLEHAAEVADEFLAEELTAAGAEAVAADGDDGHDEDDEDELEDEAAEEPAAVVPPMPPVRPSPAEPSPSIQHPSARPTPPFEPRPPQPLRQPSRPPVSAPSRPRAAPLSISDRVAARTSPLGRLLSLDAELKKHPHLTAADCRRALESFPPGWAKRRALERVLQSGHPSRLDEALALIDAVAGPGDRLWALTALADREGLSGADALRLVDAANSPALRRRIRTRIQVRR